LFLDKFAVIFGRLTKVISSVERSNNLAAEYFLEISLSERNLGALTCFVLSSAD
jgi:hypothetical protein